MSTTSAREPITITITSLDTVRIELGPEAHDELKAAISNWWSVNDPEGEVYEYLDNFRIALVGDGLSERFYEDRQAEGCCGAVDTVFGPLPCGYSFRWGFNHGH